MSTEPNTSGLKNASDNVDDQQEKQHGEQENYSSRYENNESRMLLQEQERGEQERGDEAVHLDNLLPFHPLQEVQEDILHDDDDRRHFQNALLLEPRPIKESNGIKSFVTSGGYGLFDEPMLTTSASTVSSKLPLTAILPQGRNVVVEPTNVFQFPIRFPTSGQDMMVRASKNHSLVGGVFNTYMEDEVSMSHPHKLSKDILSTTPCKQQSDKAAAVLLNEFAPLAADNTTNNKIMDCSMTAATSQSSLEQPHNKDHDTLFCSPTISMARDEDCNWLSELQCLIRSDVLEVFVQKTTNDTNSTTSSTKRRQEQLTTTGCPARVGIRCRFCAKQRVRTRRAAAFPSELSKIYQSVSMMLRDHIPKCTAIPLSLQLRLTSLHNQAKQSAFGVKQYWEYSALAIGLVDTPTGLGFSNKATRSFFNTRLVESTADKNHGKEECTPHNVVSADILTPAMTIPPFGKAVKSAMSGIPLVSEEDNLDMSPPAFFLEVMKHVELVYLDQSEITAYRRVLVGEGHPGFGCIYCGKVGRMGFCRKFPLTKKSLPNKMEEMSNHLSRCSLCPKGVKDHLKDLCYTKNERLTSKMKDDKNNFMDLVWNRLHGQDIHQCCGHTI